MFHLIALENPINGVWEYEGRGTSFEEALTSLHHNVMESPEEREIVPEDKLLDFCRDTWGYVVKRFQDDQATNWDDVDFQEVL